MITSAVVEVTAHPLGGDSAEPIDLHTGTPFDTAAYSLMKHGDLSAIRGFGAELACALIEDAPWVLTTGRPVVLPVAYLAAPPACHYLATAVGAQLTAARGDRAPARVVKVDKDSVTHIDYATASAADRQADLAGIGFRLSEPVAGAVAVVVDDIRVTGQAERVMVELLQSAGVAQVVTAYVATCDAALAADPRVEAALNHALVRDLRDMLPVIERGDFVPTIRLLKRMLADPAAAAFLAACPDELVLTFLAHARATGAAFLRAYPAGTAALLAESERRRRQPGEDAPHADARH